MNYVYRYIDKSDNIIKYIGIVCRDTENALERHFIAMYGTNRWYNKAKTTLGLLSFVKNDFEWVTLYDNYVSEKNEPYSYDDTYSCKESLVLHDKLIENYSNIIHSIKIINLMLDNAVYSIYPKEQLVKDLEILQDGKRKYEKYFDEIQSRLKDLYI